MTHDHDEDQDDRCEDAGEFEIRAHALAMAIDLNRGRQSPAHTIAADAQTFVAFLKGEDTNVGTH